MMTPVEGGRISSKFGYRKHPVSGKLDSFHNGVDIAVPIGTPVVAPLSGTITQAWDSERGGFSMAMVSDDGIRFGFAHLDSRVKNVGDRVNMGELIAFTGNTGNSTGPHLHFTIKKDHTWINPENYMDF